MLNFSVGPVMMCDEIRAMGAEQVPYFRTPEFSQVMLDSERALCGLAGAPQGSRAVFLTGSGTSGMEAVVMGALTSADKALVIDGGSFGRRFRQMLGLHGVPHEAICPQPGHSIAAEDLAPYAGGGFTAFLVNLDETSTGVLYDLKLIGDFCRENGIFLIVDAISSFLCDPISMEESGVGALIVGSQKALACPPGVCAIVLSPQGIDRVEATPQPCMYLDLRDALKNGERGQTPFTPAVTTLLQIHARLAQIERDGGAASEVSRCAAQARDFRERIADLPFEMFSKSPSNAVTSLEVPPDVDAYGIFATLKDEYGIWVCPNGGELAHRIFRVGHIGDLTSKDNETLVQALSDMAKRGLLGGGESGCEEA